MFVNFYTKYRGKSREKKKGNKRDSSIMKYRPAYQQVNKHQIKGVWFVMTSTPHTPGSAKNSAMENRTMP